MVKGTSDYILVVIQIIMLTVQLELNYWQQERFLYKENLHSALNMSPVL